MANVSDIAKGFTISGLLDADSRTHERFRVVEIPIGQIADHPANIAYSIDEGGIRELAESIRRDGITDLPLVRRMPESGYRMVSGHRRKAAYALLASENPTFAKMPCRVVDGMSGEDALVLLHTTNYFTRQLNVLERAEASKALGTEVSELRKADPSLKGVRTEDIKAAIISAHTGKRVSGKTVQRQERMAKLVEEKLAPEWREEAIAGKLTDADIERLSKMDSVEQKRMHASGEKPESPKQDPLESALRKALAQLSKAERAVSENGVTEASASLIDDVKASVTRLEEATW
ncbi:ParB/RepB/Spo0J family partition protein [Slackia exigua]|uniref:ParB/RepB/Spo0J family partition protein n=1 Tax=Slackia exigua TaxID=84109 RepID=UPI00210D765C|nr:ParB/RepB/Spo0J family partition protein [Slackia exigua]MCQ5090961.1 ParB/RepB/Spo0J family partition protein [Slackia exigua]